MDGSTYLMQEPFMVLATQNPIEHEGTYKLPEAQLDRFLFKIEVGYPTLEEQTEILVQHHKGVDKKLLDISPVLDINQIFEYRSLVRNLYVEPKLLEFTANIIHSTRTDKSLFLGASPRASLAIINAAKAIAAIRGRDFVTPEDIIYVVPSVLRHRVILTPDKEMEGITPDEILIQILQKIEIPR